MIMLADREFSLYFLLNRVAVKFWVLKGDIFTLGLIVFDIEKIKFLYSAKGLGRSNIILNFILYI